MMFEHKRTFLGNDKIITFQEVDEDEVEREKRRGEASDHSEYKFQSIASLEFDDRKFLVTSNATNAKSFLSFRRALRYYNKVRTESDIAAMSKRNEHNRIFNRIHGIYDGWWY
jgi:hypothetical protein